MSLKLSALLNPAPDSNHPSPLPPPPPTSPPYPLATHSTSHHGLDVELATSAPNTKQQNSPLGQLTLKPEPEFTPPNSATTPLHSRFQPLQLADIASKSPALHVLPSAEVSPPLTLPLHSPLVQQATSSQIHIQERKTTFPYPHSTNDSPSPSYSAPVSSIHSLLSPVRPNSALRTLDQIAPPVDTLSTKATLSSSMSAVASAPPDSAKTLDVSQAKKTPQTVPRALPDGKSDQNILYVADPTRPSFKPSQSNLAADDSSALAPSLTGSPTRASATEVIKLEDAPTPSQAWAATPTAPSLPAPTPNSGRSTPSRGTPSSVAGNGATKAKAKKGTAKRPAKPVKKGPVKGAKRATSAIADSPGSSRSATPAAGAWLTKLSATPRNSATPSASNLKRGVKKQAADGDTYMADGDDGDDGAEVYCICRKPDNHKWMIACDGCDDWFHGSCVSINEKEQNLVNQFFCPSCEKSDGTRHTTWLRMCRLITCRNPARLIKGQESKYCSDEHGHEFFRQQIAQTGPSSAANGIRKRKRAASETSFDDFESSESGSDFGEHVDSAAVKNRRGSRAVAGRRKSMGSNKKGQRTPGGALTRSQLAALVYSATHSVGDDKVAAFKTLGDPEILTSTDALDASLEDDERLAFEALEKELCELKQNTEMSKAREKFVTMVKERAKVLEKKDGIKGLCGYDPRLSWEDEGFQAWRMSEKGKRAMESEDLEPDASDEEMKDAVSSEIDDKESLEKEQNVCRKKRCQTHHNWRTVTLQEVKFEVRKCYDEELRIKEAERAIRAKVALRRVKDEGQGRREGWVETMEQNNEGNRDEKGCGPSKAEELEPNQLDTNQPNQDVDMED
ncbi:MAG: hypothetical protein M1814_002892 [Vezdaea aestivalis]|nr:MAG: hypothetical protein M1814_002892 [Vezdaea aestivalis]